MNIHEPFILSTLSSYSIYFYSHPLTLIHTTKQHSIHFEIIFETFFYFKKSLKYKFILKNIRNPELVSYDFYNTDRVIKLYTII